MKDDKQFEKDSSAADSSADSVDEYLQTLGNEDESCATTVKSNLLALMK